MLKKIKQIKKYPLFIKIIVLKIVNFILFNLTMLFSSSSKKLQHPIIFIIGPPRSGSTLLYQILTQYFDVGYISNFHANLYGSPSIIERIFNISKKKRSFDFTSFYGVTDGPTAPSECGEFWYQFFRRKPQYVPLSEANPKKMKQLRKMIYSMCSVFKKPILFKNLNCTLRLIPTFNAMPESFFIVVKRNGIDNAHSILKGRRDIYNSYDSWLGQEPPNIDIINQLPPEEQVIQQIQSIYNLIDESKRYIPDSKFIYINYEDLCKNPQKVLDLIDAFFETHNIKLKKTKVKLPKYFSKESKVSIDVSLYNKLKLKIIDFL